MNIQEIIPWASTHWAAIVQAGFAIIGAARAIILLLNHPVGQTALDKATSILNFLALHKPAVSLPTPPAA